MGVSENSPFIVRLCHVGASSVRRAVPRGGAHLREKHVSYSLNSLKGGSIADYIVDYYRGY